MLRIGFGASGDRRDRGGDRDSPDHRPHDRELEHRVHGNDADADGRGLGQPAAGWFTKLHPRYRTPVNSILFVGLVALVFGAAGIAGVGEQEAFQLLDNAAGHLLRADVSRAVRDSARRFADTRREPAALAARSRRCPGFAVTLLYVVLSIFPIIDVASWWSFAMKISGVVVGFNLIGAGLFWNASVVVRTACHGLALSPADGHGTV